MMDNDRGTNPNRAYPSRLIPGFYHDVCGCWNHPLTVYVTAARFIGRGLAIAPIGALRLSVPFNADGTCADNSL